MARYLVIEIFLLSANAILGMSFMPEVKCLASENCEDGKIVRFMLAPMLGAAVWLALSVF